MKCDVPDCHYDHEDEAECYDHELADYYTKMGRLLRSDPMDKKPTRWERFLRWVNSFFLR